MDLVCRAGRFPLGKKTHYKRPRAAAARGRLYPGVVIFRSP